MTSKLSTIKEADSYVRNARNTPTNQWNWRINQLLTYYQFPLLQLQIFLFFCIVLKNESSTQWIKNTFLKNLCFIIYFLA